ncbi:MAG: ribosome maturation factor RimP [Oligoflexus sp.]
MNRKKLNDIIALIEPHVRDLGFECLEIEWDLEEKAARVFIDGPNGIVMDDCLKVNRVLIDLSALDQLLPNDFRLEVSSPGIERPLRTKEHFQKVIGEKINVQLTEASGDRQQAIGKLVEVKDDGLISMELPSASWQFPLDLLQRANLVYDWNKL